MNEHDGGITVRDALRMVDEFRALLADLGVKLSASSPATSELAAVQSVMEWITGGMEPPVSEAWRTTVQDSVCAIQLAELTLRRRDAGLPLEPFAAHFRLLEAGSLRLSADSAASEHNHKLFELLVGLAIAPFAADVRLAHPWNAQDENPDVTATIDGRRWGFACKVPHSRNPQTIHDRIVEGFGQVERADVDNGLVVLSSKNILKSSDLLPIGERDGRPGVLVQPTERATELFGQTFDGLMNGVNGLAGAVSRPAGQHAGKAVPFAFWIGTLATVSSRNGQLRPTLQSVAGGWRVALPDSPVPEDVVRSLLDRLRAELAR